MRKGIILTAASLISLMLSGVSHLSAETSMPDRIFMQKKDVCLLYAMNCSDNAYQIQQRIKHLRGEIMRGYAVYNDEELRMLIKKLDEAKQTLHFLMKEGA